MSKRKTEHNLKNTTQVYQKIQKIKEQITSKTIDSNKPAPGDADAKTKTSKHTKKFRQMYGETKKELKDACWTRL